jgi:hypothetical protein
VRSATRRGHLAVAAKKADVAIAWGKLVVGHVRSYRRWPNHSAQQQASVRWVASAAERNEIRRRADEPFRRAVV